MSAPDLALGTIGQIMVPVTDVERATAFYRDVLRIPFLFAFPGMAFFDAGGVRLYLDRPTEPGFDGRATLYFRVAGIADAAAELATRGAELVTKPHRVFDDGTSTLWLAFFRDPDGNNIGLMEEVPNSPPSA